MKPDRVLARLKPSAREIERLAFNETDQARASSFEPITPGPVVASLMLAAIAVAGIVCAPVRLLLGRSRK